MLFQLHMILQTRWTEEAMVELKEKNPNMKATQIAKEAEAIARNKLIIYQQKKKRVGTRSDSDSDSESD